MRNAPLKFLIVGIIVTIALIVIGTLKISDGLVYFYTPDEAFAKAAELQDRTVRVGGLVKPETVVWNREALDLRFVLTDMVGHEIQVAHRGTPPDMFREGQGVVVEGRLGEDGSQFSSRKLLVKHSEEYKKPDDLTMTDRALLEKSLFKTDSANEPANPYDYGKNQDDYNDAIK